MKKLIIKCPTCTKQHNYYQSKPWSPFCSERCHMIDLGAWASEEHRIKGEPIVHSEQASDANNINHSNDLLN